MGDVPDRPLPLPFNPDNILLCRIPVPSSYLLAGVRANGYTYKQNTKLNSDGPRSIWKSWVTSLSGKLEKSPLSSSINPLGDNFRNSQAQRVG